MRLFGKERSQPKTHEEYENVTDGAMCFRLGKEVYDKSIERSAEYYRRGAEQFNHGECQYELGRLYLMLYIVETPNLGLVVHWYKKAIGNNISGYELPLTIALIYLFGDDDIKYETEALKWIKKAAENNPECYTVIGDAYYAGGVPFCEKSKMIIAFGDNDFAKSHSIYENPPGYKFSINRKSEERNCVKALACYLKAAKYLPEDDLLAIKITYIYFHGGFGVEKDYKKALDWSNRIWGEASRIEESYMILITVYRDGGYGVEKDIQKALDYCSLDKEWAFNLEAGEIYQFYLYPPDFGKAAICYRNAADNDSLASTRLGYLYLKGLGVDKSIQYAKNYLVDDYHQGYFLHHGINAIFDYGRAAEFYGKCKSGSRFYGKAVNQLGLLHQTSGDFEIAIRFFKSAAEENCHDAFNSLGDVYKYGRGEDIDYDEAFRWYTKAAEEPMDNGGQFNLAVMYSEGKGTQINHKLALYWFEKAKMYGNEQVDPLHISQTRTLVEYSEKIDILEAQLKSIRTCVQVSQENKELPKMFHVENKRL